MRLIVAQSATGFQFPFLPSNFIPGLLTLDCWAILHMECVLTSSASIDCCIALSIQLGYKKAALSPFGFYKAQYQANSSEKGHSTTIDSWDCYFASIICSRYRPNATYQSGGRDRRALAPEPCTIWSQHHVGARVARTFISCFWLSILIDSSQTTNTNSLDPEW